MIFDIHRVRRELTNFKVCVIYDAWYFTIIISALFAEWFEIWSTLTSIFFKAAKSDAYISFTLHWKAVSLFLIENWPFLFGFKSSRVTCEAFAIMYGKCTRKCQPQYHLRQKYLKPEKCLWCEYAVFWWVIL